MLDKAIDILTGIDHPDTIDALREICVVNAAIRHYQMVLHKMDRDDKQIERLINRIKKAHDIPVATQNRITKSLGNMRKPITVKYDEMMVDFEKMTDEIKLGVLRD